MSYKPLRLEDQYGRKYNITDLTAQIGSGTERTVVLEEPDVLDLHAELSFEDSEWVLQDRSDGKGIRVNDELVQTSQVLKDGDKISIGSTFLRVAIETEEDLSVFRTNGEIGTGTSTATTPPSEPVKKRCNTCGALIFQEAEICPNCGVRQIKGKRSKVAAGLLGIFLGSFGLHKFYLGQTGLGILYLLFFWTYIPGIVGFIEGIIYLSMNDEKFAEKYG